jgi:glucose-1-phosphate thymidylyltransferase
VHVIIPVAGKGTRLRPHTWSTPKALLPVAGRPILAHIVDALLDAGMDRMTLITGYLGDQIIDWARKTYSIPVEFARQEVTDGLASAVHLAAPWCDDRPTMVALGDTIFQADLSSLPDGSRNLLGVQRVKDPRRFGVVVMDGDRVERLVEKPEEFVSDLAIVGLYSFRSGSELVSACRKLIESGRTTRGEFQLTDAMQLMLDEGSGFGTFEVNGWFDCGKVETMLETNRVLLEADPPAVPEGVLTDSAVVPPVYIAHDARITGSVVGPWASIGPGTVVERSVLRDCIVGSGSRIDSAVLEGTLIGSDAAVTGGATSLSCGDGTVIEF